MSIERQLLVVALVCCWLPQAGAAQPFDPFTAAGIDTAHVGRPLALDSRFTDQQGRSVRLGDLLNGQPTLLVPLYYRCPNVCGAALSTLFSQLANQPYRLGRDFQVIAFSFDPREDVGAAREELAKLSQHLPALADEPGVHLLTGDASASQALADSIGFGYRFDPQQQQYAHSSAVAVVTGDGRLSRWLYGLGYQPSDLRLALTEAGQGKLGGHQGTTVIAVLPLRPAERHLQQADHSAAASGRRVDGTGARPADFAGGAARTSGGAMNENFLRLWPAQASDYAVSVDWLVIGFTAMMALFVVPVFVALWVFIWRYRRGLPADRDHRPQSNLPIELAWIILPFIGSLVVFLLSARLFFIARTPPEDALEVQVTARQWMWKFQHQGGQREINTLHVPARRPVKLTMISEDVIHSLFFPSLRIKQDVLPGRYSMLWFQAEHSGTYEVYCAEYCGTDHAAMLARLVVLNPADYEHWLADNGSSADLARQGETLYRQYGCASCHDSGNAPPLAGVFNRSVQLADGSQVKADEAYLRDSILLPQKQLVAGYLPIMPTYSNLLDEEAVQRLVAYLRELPEKHQ